MNTLLNAIKEQLNTTTTANGDIAYKSTLNANLDFFSSFSTLRNKREEDLLEIFSNAYKEDKVLAIKNLFYTRDILDGAGERKAFRTILVYLANYEPEAFEFVLPHVPNLGRWDDLTKIIKEVVNKDSKNKLVNFVGNQLKEDLKNLKANKPVSLLAKWMPSMNNKKLRPLALSWFNILFPQPGTKFSVYQKSLVALRSKIDLIESRLTENDFTFNYSHVPAKASLAYKNTFLRKDEKRYNEFIDSAKKDKTVIKDKVAKLQPQDIVKLIAPYGVNPYSDEKTKEIANTYWEALDRPGFKDNENVIVVRDGSASMQGVPMLVATSMALYTSEQLTGDFHNKFITFSANPKLVEIPDSCKTLFDKIKFISKYNEIQNTDLDKTFKLLYEANLKSDPKDRISKIMIISDMEFDYQTTNGNKSTFDKWRDKFTEAGMEMPKTIFWNVNARRTIYPTTNLHNLYLVSGYTKAIMRDAMNGVEPDAIKNMISTLSKYDKFFE